MTLAKSDQATSDMSYADVFFWKSADAPRGQIDTAKYKHVVLGLFFLRSISASFGKQFVGTWVLHFFFLLAPARTGGFMLANSSMLSN